MSQVNIQLGDDRIVKAATSTSSAEHLASSNTKKMLETLLLASNKLRQRSEAVAAGMEAVPRTKAIEHALLNQNPSSSSS
ncbi:uncharacterized protein LAJ45_11455 [Morchella importuna]|uniref:uncharacterized protein n=1 Tax=Morchella importuna TaxID=1174673 RepID=UPI001E8CBFD2|nr:uncharacterized protein LAJ45_11455 [Morchella importuna]KAH8144558.1 hypothetical protein LAJ45_11455 [Morchella importuna]